jgi:hypothetical protein
LRTRTTFALLALAMAVTACGSSSRSTATSTPSAAESVAPALNVTATAEDYTGKPAPAGAIVMTMSKFMFNPSVPVGSGSKIVIYIDNRDPERNDCEGGPGGIAGSDQCYQHGLLVLGPGGIAALGKTDTVPPGHQAVLTLDGMRPGVYKFYCPVTGHRFIGMTGSLTVS